MRVLHITPYFAPAFGYGGPPRSILALCQAQQSAGLDVHVLTTTANADQAPLPAGEGVEDGIRVERFPLAGAPMLFWAPALKKALGDYAPTVDVLHGHGLFNAPAWQLHRVATRTNRPYVVSVRGMLAPHARAHHALRKHAAWAMFDQRVVSDAALLHTTSAVETAQVQRVAPSVRIAEIPNALAAATASASEDDVARFRARFNVPADAPIVAFVGRLHPIKRLDLLADAFARVATQHATVRLVIAGNGDQAIKSSVDRATAAVRDRVIWLGETSAADRDTLLATAATLVACSNTENFGMSVAEAMRAGVAPIVTQTCPWELLAREEAGWWVPQTADEIASAIDAVLTEPTRARAMGQRARRLACERFSGAAIGAKWRDVYQTVLAGHHG